MAKPSDTHLPEIVSSSTTIAKEIPSQRVSAVTNFLRNMGVSDPVPDNCNTKDFYSDLVRGFLKPDRVLRGRVTCILTIKPPVANFYGSLHGGAVAVAAETVSIACAKTVVAEDKGLSLGELSISYLSGAPMNAEVIVDGSVVRSGRNFTLVAVEFKLKKTGQLVYTARATFYNMPIAKL
ncbi:hypothetical protein FH972_004206 [Carpinus fangiana]|uniref:Thioesterase domain-containing protein n=1 Tax=Carpinus fangiana TaxID=176857 RepID=A0A5N6QMV5_9ROSI|nr:hypothetical protein FH972_004206 [Carpinus fangiana]